ncbi:MAG TPA: hypothetical protein VNK26_08910 [Pyrinomonadaceae bacterium]|nr:hypothetical protein [Pyrinomonadaceae bacterium]
MTTCLLGMNAQISFSQTKTVTNADLEKFRQRRLAAEKQLDDYYKSIGLTREDIEKQQAAEQKEREELALKLKSLRLAKEQAEAELESALASSQPQQNYIYMQQPPLYAEFYLYGNRLYRNVPIWNRPYGQVYWRATPGGVVYEPGSRSSYIWMPPQPYIPRPAWREPRQNHRP